MISDRTSYLLVTDAAAPERSDVLGFLAELRERGMQFTGFLVNRTAPQVRHRDLPAALDRPAQLTDPQWQAWSDALTAIPEAARRRAAAHAEGVERLRKHAGPSPIWRVPEIPGGITDLVGLERLAPYLPPNPPSY